MQKIFSFSRRFMAKTVPMAMVAGRAGGKTTVITSRPREMIKYTLAPRKIKFTTATANPRAAITAMIPINTIESR